MYHLPTFHVRSMGLFFSSILLSVGCLSLHPSIAATDASPNAVATAEPAVEPLISKRYGTLLLKDTGHVLSAPIRWKMRDWALFGADTAVVIGTAAVLDRPIQKVVQRNRGEAANTVASIFNPLGNEYALVIPGGFYLAGMVWHDNKAKAVAQDSVAASLVEAGIITPTVKLVVGRSRPKEDEGAYRFNPFSGQGVFSSGHTGEAFALASVIAEHYDPLWVKCTAYGIAGFVGFARVVDNAHFLSDVVAGALIGTAVGQAIVRFNKQERLRFSPLVEEKTKGLKAVYAF